MTHSSILAILSFVKILILLFILTLPFILALMSGPAGAGIECPEAEFEKAAVLVKKLENQNCEWDEGAAQALQHLKELARESSCPRKELSTARELLVKLRIDRSLDEKSLDCSSRVEEILQAIVKARPQARKVVAPANGPR